VGAPPSDLSADQRQLLRAEYSNLLACVRCGLCLTSCPTYVLTLNEAESPRGRVGMMRALADGELALTPDLVEHELTCLVCDACTAVCPAGVHMDPLQVALRSAIDAGVRRSRTKRLVRNVVFGRVFANMNVFRSVVRLLWIYQRSGLQWLARKLGVLRLMRLADAERLLPRIATRFVVPHGEVYSAAQASARVQLFAGCVMSTALAEVDRATVRVLQRAGCAVELPVGQGCCGALNAHGGDLQGARELARRTIAAFQSDQAEPIIVNSAGCGAMLKDYAHHFRDDPTWAAPARTFSARVQDVSEFLATRSLPMRHTLDASVVYQDACHLAHAQRIGAQPRALLRQIPGLKLQEMAEPGLCCGSAGVYNVTNPSESVRLRDRKVQHILATGAEVVATANPGCLFQLRSGLMQTDGVKAIEVKHVVELLDSASAP
jgi:glycolate oxidase iron-sulfur subunit